MTALARVPLSLESSGGGGGGGGVVLRENALRLNWAVALAEKGRLLRSNVLGSWLKVFISRCVKLRSEIGFEFRF